jgi:hypothetical protein
VRIARSSDQSAPGTTRDLVAEETKPPQLVAACLRAMDAVERGMIAERIRAAHLRADPRTSAAIERGGLRPFERQAVFELIREQLAEIVASIARAGPE